MFKIREDSLATAPLGVGTCRIALCSVKYIVAVVYVRLHILISSLPLFKSPKKYRFHKKFPYFKGNNLKVSIGVLLDIFFL